MITYHDLEEGPGDDDPGWGFIVCNDPHYDELDKQDCDQNIRRYGL